MTLLTNATILSAVQAALPDVTGVWVYGSYVHERMRVDSDVDIAVMLHGKTSALQIWEAANEISLNIHRDVDLVDIRSVGTLLQFQIVTSGRRLLAFGNEPFTYEIFALKSMNELSALHAAQVADILQRGSVYGK